MKLTREQLDQERASSLARQRAVADAVVAQIRARRGREEEEAVQADRDWFNKRPAPVFERRCTSCGDRFFVRRKQGRPITRCLDCR
jgi:Rod binding domain-containing protein